MRWWYDCYHCSSKNGMLESDRHVHFEVSSDGAFAHRPALPFVPRSGGLNSTNLVFVARYYAIIFEATLRTHLQFLKELFFSIESSEQFHSETVLWRVLMSSLQSGSGTLAEAADAGLRGRGPQHRYSPDDRNRRAPAAGPSSLWSTKKNPSTIKKPLLLVILISLLLLPSFLPLWGIPASPLFL